MNKFTPGPWKYEFEEYGGYDCMEDSYDVRDFNNKMIVCVDFMDYREEGEHEIAEANAKLISIAPEMYHFINLLYEHKHLNEEEMAIAKRLLAQID